MELTKKDLKRIGKNFAAIREAYGYGSQRQFAYALDKKAHFEGLSYDLIKKIESGNYEKLQEKTIRLFSEITFIPFEKILNNDLTKELEPNSLDLENESMSQLLQDEIFIKEAWDFVCETFPLFSTDETLKNKEFKEAVDLSNTLYKNIEKTNDIILLFEKTNTCEGYLNILSIVGRYYVWFLYKPIMKTDFENILKSGLKEPVEVGKKIHLNREYKKDEFSTYKNDFLNDELNRFLTKCMIIGLNQNEYKDFIYYYLALRYYYGILDNKITKLTDTEMNSFGISLLNCLEVLENKYAIKFNNNVKNF